MIQSISLRHIQKKIFDILVNIKFENLNTYLECSKSFISCTDDCLILNSAINRNYFCADAVGRSYLGHIFFRSIVYIIYEKAKHKGCTPNQFFT